MVNQVIIKVSHDPSTKRIGIEVIDGRTGKGNIAVIV